MNKVRPELRRRIAPATALTLDLQSESGESVRFDLKLVFDFNAIALVEETLHVNLLMGDVIGKMSGSALSVFFWASLLACQPEYAGLEGLAVVRSYMDLGNASLIGSAVLDAFLKSLPLEQQEALRRPSPPVRTTTVSAGAISGPSLDTISDLIPKSSAN